MRKKYSISMSKKRFYKKNIRFPISIRIINRILLFFTSSTLAFALLYVVGNFQHFLDSNQKTILFCCSITASVLIIISIFAFIQYTLFWILNNTLPRIKYYLFYLLLIIYSVSIAVLAHGVLFIAAGKILY